MSDQQSRILDQLTKLTEVVSSQAVTLGRVEERLGFYNTRLKSLEKTDDAGFKSLDARIEPLESHVLKVRQVSKAVAWILGIVTPIAIAAAVAHGK